MAELITFIQISKTTGLARTTIKRRVKHLKIKVFKDNNKKIGRPENAIEYKYVKDLVSFNYREFKNMKGRSINKSNKEYRDQFATKHKESDNRENGLYHRLCDDYLLLRSYASWDI